MKITIEPTESHDSFPYPTVTISYPNDDLECEQVREVVLSALVAWGYHHELVFSEENKISELEGEIEQLTGMIDHVRLPDKKTKKRS